MNREKLSLFEWTSLQLMLLPMIGHFLLLRPLLESSGQDAWMAALAGIVPACLFTWLLVKVHTRLEGKSLLEGLVTHSPLLGRVLTGLLVLYALVIITFAYETMEMVINLMFMPETPNWAVGGIMFLMMCLALRKHPRHVAQMSTVFFLGITVTGFLVGMNLQDEKEYARILPIFESGWHPLLKSFVLICGSWVELLFALQMTVQDGTKKRIRRGLIFIVVANTWLTAMSLIAVVATFGLGTALQLDWILLDSTRLLKFGFYDRVDVYGMYTVTFSAFIRIVFYAFVVRDGMQEIIGKKWRSYLNALMMLVPFFLSLQSVWNSAQLFEWIQLFYRDTAPMLLLPLCFLFLLRKKNTNSLSRSMEGS